MESKRRFTGAREKGSVFLVTPEPPAQPSSSPCPGSAEETGPERLALRDLTPWH